jgi:hypothetical protein
LNSIVKYLPVSLPCLFLPVLMITGSVVVISVSPVGYLLFNDDILAHVI